MRIAITGSEGFIGKALSDRLLAEGNEVIRIDLASGYDILDMNAMMNIPAFDTLVHLAGRLMVPESYQIPHAYYETNVRGTLNMLELCRLRGAKLLFFSSYLYGQPIYQPIDEKHPLSPFNPYAQSKILAEDLCKAYQRDFGVPVTIFRPFNIYGPGQNPHFLIPKIITQCIKGNIQLQDPRPKRDYIFISDIVDACLAVFNTQATGFQLYNLGTGISYSIAEVIEIIKTHISHPVTVEFTHETRENEVLDTICNNQKALSELGWSPKVSLEKGLKLMITQALKQ